MGEGVLWIAFSSPTQHIPLLSPPFTPSLSNRSLPWHECHQNASQNSNAGWNLNASLYANGSFWLLSHAFSVFWALLLSLTHARNASGSHHHRVCLTSGRFFGTSDARIWRGRTPTALVAHLIFEVLVETLNLSKSVSFIFPFLVFVLDRCILLLIGWVSVDWVSLPWIL